MNFDDLLRQGNRGPPVRRDPKARGDPLDSPMVELVPGKDVLTARHLCEGTLVFGSTGSGKSSGSGRVIRDAMLRAGWGGLVLTVKDDARDWFDAMKAIGREGDLIRFGAEGAGYCFNPFEHERTRASRGGGLVENVVGILGELEAVAEPGVGKDGSDAYFRLATRDCTRMCVTLLMLAGMPLTTSHFYDLLSTAPAQPPEVNDPKWRKTSFAWMVLEAARERATAETENDGRRTRDYFLRRLPTMSEKTRACIAEGLLARLSVLSSGPLGRLFAGAVNWTPDLIYQGKLTVVDLPMLTFGEMGRLANVLMKTSFMRDVQRREVGADTKPVFLWSDEAHYMLSPNDQLFLTTARSARCATVMLTQNLSNLLAALGGGKEAEPVVGSLLGNMRTKIVHSVEEQKTTEYMSDLIGYSVQLLTGMSVPTGSHAERTEAGQLAAANLTPQRMFRVEPSEFQALKTGGPLNDFVVEGVVYRGGQKFSNNQSFLKVAFDQRTGRAV